MFFLWKNLSKLYQRTFLLWFFTFVIILPFPSQKWVFSPYFYVTVTDEYRESAHELVTKLNLKRFEHAQKYLSNLNSKMNFELHASALNNETEMVAVVITKRRLADCQSAKVNELCEPHYLQQTLVALDREIKLYGERKVRPFIPILVCNTEQNLKDFHDFQMVKEAFPVIFRHSENKSNDETRSQNYNSNWVKRTQESSDYAFCLESILNISTKSPTLKYVLVLQDDAVAFPNFFEQLFQVLDYRIERKMSQGELIPGRNWSYVKIYYPERWSGLGTETPSEFVTIATVGFLVGILVKLCITNPRETNSFRDLLIFGIITGGYAILLVLVISRQTLLELRRFHPSLLKVDKAPGCCIPGVVYPLSSLQPIVEYLKSSKCEQCDTGVDLALDDWSEMNQLISYLVQPNLVRHVGMYSTLTGRKDAIPMLFHDLLYE